MIPQALSNDAKMIVIFEGMDPRVVQLNTVGVKEWKAGVNYIYNLMEGEYFFEFGEVNVECPYSGGEFKFDMASEYYSQNGTYTDVGWSVEIISSIVDGVDMTSDSTSTIWITGINDINDKNEINLSKTLQVAPSTYTSTNDLDQGLQQATVVSHADMINLAKVGDVYSTANCYVVNAPGWYMFPCFVKGNGIENNPNPVINNNKSVPASQTTTKSRLFMKSTDYTDIVKIETNDAYPELVWQDAPGLISDIEFNSTKEYIQFYISPETIRSGNAIIAL